MSKLRTEERITLSVGQYQQAVDKRLEKFERELFAKKLWAKDTSIWPGDEKVQKSISGRLGWLDAPTQSIPLIKELESFAIEVLKEGFTHAVLLGMGGSSLAPEVFQKTMGHQKKYPALMVLDSTDPEAIGAVESKVDLDKTLFIVASKSGTTIETHSLFLYFFEQMKNRKGDGAGKHFVAITDAGTGLVQTAQSLGFRKIFLGPADVGGRYSALIYFGLLPAALMGVNIADVLSRAQQLASDCGRDVPARENSFLVLGAVLGELCMAGRDKLILVLPPKISSLADWIEQLVAESTGKSGKGIVPVVREPRVDVSACGRDRLYVFFDLDDASNFMKEKKQLTSKGQPWIGCHLRDTADVGAAFLLWELATAVAGATLDINPFDEPNVSESKENTNCILNGQNNPQAIGEIDSQDGKKLTEEFLKMFNASREGEYTAFLIYAKHADKNNKCLDKLRKAITRRYHLATTLGYGPRYLHSTGQLHKGGPNKGIFVQIIHKLKSKKPIPSKAYSFEDLKQAQGLGDYLSLKSKDRRILRIVIDDNFNKGLSNTVETLVRACEGKV